MSGGKRGEGRSPLDARMGATRKGNLHSSLVMVVVMLLLERKHTAIAEISWAMGALRGGHCFVMRAFQLLALGWALET